MQKNHVKAICILMKARNCHMVLILLIIQCSLAKIRLVITPYVSIVLCSSTYFQTSRVIKLLSYRLFLIRSTSYFGLRIPFSVFLSAVILYLRIFVAFLENLNKKLVKIPLFSCFAYFHQELCYSYFSIVTSGFWLYEGWQCPLASHQCSSWDTYYTGNREFPIHSIHTCEFMAHHLLYSLDTAVIR